MPCLNEAETIARCIQKGGAERAGIQVTEREHVSHFDAPNDGQQALPVRRWITFDDFAYVGDAIRFAAVAAEVDSAQVIVDFVRAAHKVRQRRNLAIGNQRHGRRNADRSEITGGAFER